MRHLSELFRRILYLFRRKQMDADLAEEMRLHLELREADQIAAGAEPSEAAAAARKQFGNATRLQEKGRDAWGWGWLDSLAQDVRYGFRGLRASRGFTITAVVSLALGIGANTAIFSIVNAVMLRSLPVPNPHQLVEVRRSGSRSPTFTNPLWEAIRDHQDVFSSAAAFGERQFDLAEAGEKRLVQGLFVSGGFFETAAITPLSGRLISRDDDLRGGGKFGPVAVISHRFWQRHFGGAPDAVGRTVKVDRQTFEVIGVTGPDFKGFNIDTGFDVAVPIACEPMFNPDGSALDARSSWWLRVVGRLQPKFSLDQAAVRMKALSPEIMRLAVPDWDAGGKKRFLETLLEFHPAATGFSRTGTQYRTALFTVMVVVGLVLLIACVNIANLMLARGAARRQEISVRLAIGAERRRVVRQLITESLLLAMLGIPGGLLLAKWGSQFLVQRLSTGNSQLALDASLDGTVLLFTIGISLVTGILFGLVPAIRSTRVGTNETLKQSARGAVAGASRFNLGKGLVAGQVALSLCLVVGAGLFVGTMRNLLNVSLGFDPNGVLIVTVDTLQKVPREKRLQLYTTILEHLRLIPGVASAATASSIPITGSFWNGRLDLQGAGHTPITDDKLTFFQRVSPDFFQTMRTQLILGRDFNERDTHAAQRVVILGEKTARELFGNDNPIGKLVEMEGSSPGNTFEVIGVVRDIKYLMIAENTRRTAFFTLAQESNPGGRITYMLRTAGSSASILPAIRKTVADVNPGLSIQFGNLKTTVDSSLQQQRLVAILSSFFGALALILAVIGLYGVTSYSAAQRTGEIGVRMALGARRSSVIWLVLRDVALILSMGCFLGVIISVAAGRYVETMMFNLQASDPFTLITAAVFLGGTGIVAGLFPAWRASQIDPSAALRCQ
jgi:putative ABC transport system permease protein